MVVSILQFPPKCGQITCRLWTAVQCWFWKFVLGTRRPWSCRRGGCDSYLPKRNHLLTPSYIYCLFFYHILNLSFFSFRILKGKVPSLSSLLQLEGFLNSLGKFHDLSCMSAVVLWTKWALFLKEDGHLLLGKQRNKYQIHQDGVASDKRAQTTRPSGTDTDLS